MNAEGLIGMIVSARFADGSLHSVGRVYAASNRPTVMMQMPDGSRQTWIADMCTVVCGGEIAEKLLPLVAKDESEARVG